MSRAAARTALVTGTSRGLGLATAAELARRGDRVIATARGPGAAAAAAREIGGDVEAEELDVADPASVAALADRLRAAGRTIDLLVNNAAIALDGFDAEVVRRTLAVNFTGAMQVTDALLPLVPDGGVIVMVTSGVGTLADMPPPIRARFADPALTRDGLVQLMSEFAPDVEAGRHTEVGWPSSAYRVSKAGLNALVRIFAPELSARRIRLVAVCPGWVRTDLGGRNATRSLAEGAESILRACAATGPTGVFTRDGAVIPW
jgi:NAD(P)-dependent dehydrogenase (short-subunit alcohol dehydrogenase family)